jgi:cellulose synthase/poly-beta-1,6-N-acetylglucosamine synthase-like glycosyltransferase
MLETTARLVFWTTVLSITYAYAGFPLLVTMVGTFRKRNVRKASVTPRMSLIIAAYNEEECIGQRMENALAMDYPADDLEIIIASDGSSDGTEAIVEGYGDRGVRLLSLPRQGKILALAAAVREATGEVLVFSDANTVVHPRALREMASNFADPEVGGVVGHTGYWIEEGSESSSRGENSYWRYDTWIKELESRTGSVVSAHGGLYALRRELFQPPTDTAVTDDFYISTGVVERGFRLVFEPEARALEAAVKTSEREFSRRVRLMTRGLRGVWLRRRLLNPFDYGFYALTLFSHKLLRRLLPVALVLLLAASALLASSHPFYAAALGAQVAFYAFGTAGYLFKSTRVGRWKLFYLPFFFCMANAASLLAVSRFLRGDRVTLWQPQRHAVQG